MYDIAAYACLTELLNNYNLQNETSNQLKLINCSRLFNIIISYSFC